MPLAAVLSKPQKSELTVILPELLAWLEKRGWTALMDQESTGYLRQVGIEVVHRVAERDAAGGLRLTFDVRMTGPSRLLEVARAIEAVPGVRRLKIEKL